MAPTRFLPPYNQALASIFWQQEHLPAGADKFRAFIWGPLGGTIACCYILLAFLAKYAFPKKEKWAYWATVVAFGIWIAIDSSVAIYYGVYFPAWLINAFSFLVKALPLVFYVAGFFWSRQTGAPETVSPLERAGYCLQQIV